MLASRLWVPGEDDRPIQQSMLPHELNDPLGTPRHAPTNESSVLCPAVNELDELQEQGRQFQFEAAAVPLHVSIPARHRAIERQL